LSKLSKELTRLLTLLLEQNGSDLHLKSGAAPKMRINGVINSLSRDIIAPQAIAEIAQEIMTPEEWARFERDQEIDFMFQAPRLGRFRVNVYRQMMGLAIAMRHIQGDIPSIDELNLPQVLYTLISRPRGLILITGATGSGKSTTLAAMVETLNRTAQLNIITIEDPIEFAFKEKKCSIQQREVGRDTPSWGEALRRIMRQDPDVIVLGEIRDAETMLTGLTAANTGHLVLATMHTMDTTQTVNRVLSFAPAELQTETRYVLSSTLVAVISLRLLSRLDKAGRVPAVEVMVATETIRKLILDPAMTLNIRNAVADGFGQYGMQTFDQALMQLYKEGVISLSEALKNATSPTDFKIKARGIDGQTSGYGWGEPATSATPPGPVKSRDQVHGGASYKPGAGDHDD